MKTFIYKIYDKNGTFLTTIDDSVIISSPKFSQKINGGQGEMQIELAMRWDSPESWTNIFNFIRVFCVDSVNPLGKLIYSGFIAEREPAVDSNGEVVSLTVYGLVTLLTKSKYKDGGSFTVIHASQDPATIINAVIAHFQSLYAPTSGNEWIGTDSVIINGITIRTGSQVSTFGTNFSYKFENLNWAGVMDEVLKMSSSDWYWFIDSGGDVIFSQKPATATHTLTIGENVVAVTPPETVKDLINSVTLVYDGGTVTVTDSASISTYGLSEDQQTDKNVTDSITATSLATSILNSKKDPILQAKITVNSSYAIETIRPGQTLKLRNYQKGSVVLGDNMVIVSTSYIGGDFLEIEVGGERFDVAKETANIAEYEAERAIQKKGLTTLTGGTGAVSSVFGRIGIVVAETNDYTWAQINKTISSLADITTRSHTLLTDIGSNTHAQIDSHIGSTANDDHTQYALLAGRAGGQTLTGGTASGNDLTLRSTSNATKGKIIFGTSAYDEVNNRLGINIATPLAIIHAVGTGSSSATYSLLVRNSSSLNLLAVRNDGVISGSHIQSYLGNSVYFGVQSGTNDDATDNRNSGFGTNTLYSSTTGDKNTAIGFSALYANTIGTENTAIGYTALYYNTEGNYNTAVGVSSLFTNTTGFSNTAVGFSALFSNTTGKYNTGYGLEALYSNTTGDSNTAIGIEALYSNTTGQLNTAVGESAGSSNTNGWGNTAVGQGALYANTSGVYNTAIGRYALFTIANGYNVGVGNNAGRYIADGVTQNTASVYSVFIGNNCKALAGGTNEIVIGYNAVGNGAHTATIGNSSLVACYTFGNLIPSENLKFYTGKGIYSDLDDPFIEFISPAGDGGGAYLEMSVGIDEGDPVTFETVGDLDNIAYRIAPKGTGKLQVSYLTAGSVLFSGTDGQVLQDNANFFWDNANNRLGVGTATPNVAGHVHGAGNTSLRISNSTLGITKGLLATSNTDATASLVNMENGALKLGANGTTFVDIGTTGNIDTASPTLTINTGTGGTGYLNLKTTGTKNQEFGMYRSSDLSDFFKITKGFVKVTFDSAHKYFFAVGGTTAMELSSGGVLSVVGKVYCETLKTAQSHPTNYKEVYVNTATGELYRIS